MGGGVRRAGCALLVLLAVLAGWPAIARAQAPPRNGEVALEAVAGYAGFIDEEMIDHLALGGTLRYRAKGRVQIEGTVLHLNGPGSDRDWVIMPGVALDLGRGRVVPYITGGVGWLRSTLPVGTGPYTSWSWSVAAGAGVRVRAGSHGYVGLEARLGTEPLTRLTAIAGWRIGR